jgi:hypothetical protein
VSTASKTHKCPPVLQLHLRRFEFAYASERNVKISNRFVVLHAIDVEPHIAPDADRAKANAYFLYGALTHAGP